ncbi:MAG: class I SAM-dependent methyltransferase, partial [Pseudomonadota bacterium]|nr:class I SAM-dependent methyltransferase [Pseudomonadota bacterium]
MNAKEALRVTSFEQQENLHPTARASTVHPLLEAFQQAEHGQLLLHAPEGTAYGFHGNKPGPEAYLRLHSWNALDALLARGEVGFAEAYIAGLWDTGDLPALLAWGLMNADSLERYFYGRPLHALLMRIKAIAHANTLSGSKRNILKHYDLGNDFYRLWLDPSMTYSCALFEGDKSKSLADAQAAKYRRILNKLGAKEGDHILEIGCGWGGFAQAAAEAGVRVTGITISVEQKIYAEERLSRLGLSHLARIELTDYREIEGQFDHIVSIGMFEHVGEKFWPGYFEVVKQRLKPGGKAMVHSITIDEEVFTRTHGKLGFIETYIFPGGELPPKSRFRAAAESAGLSCKEMFAFGKDYALTVRRWSE